MSKEFNIAWKLFMIQELWGSCLASHSVRAVGYVRCQVTSSVPLNSSHSFYHHIH